MQAPQWYTRDVSRETSEALDAYADLLRRWTTKINLISKSTVDELENRHIWDSAQGYSGQTGRWMDLGSGGGLPAVVVAVLAKGEGNDLSTICVESDLRKATFLRTCARDLKIRLSVLDRRIDMIPKNPSDTVSARALADLDKLIGMAEPHLNPDGMCVFMKGATWKQEIDAAQRNWRFSYEAEPSNTDANAAILRIRGIERV